MAGLRERKKKQTRNDIFEAAHRLFLRRGFDSVTVADVAREADVSEMTVFNHFPTKEDLFFAGMQFFEEQLVEAVRDRARGESALAAFRRRVVEGAPNLRRRGRDDAITRAARAVASSPPLQARERQIVEEFTSKLAGLLPGDVEAKVVAAALMAAHRALVDHVRLRAAAGRRGARLEDDFRTAARRVFGRLERGLAGYAVKR